MASKFLCPRCERTYQRPWLLSGRCDDCHVKLERWRPAFVRKHEAEGKSVSATDLAGWPPLAPGVRVWTVVDSRQRPSGPENLFIERSPTDTFQLERREQLMHGCVSITSEQQALTYVRLLYGHDPRQERHGGSLGRLTVQEPAYFELTGVLRLDNRIFTLEGFDPSQIVPTVEERSDGEQRSFHITRHAVPRDALPTQRGVKQPLKRILHLAEVVHADGRYECEASELPSLTSDYRQEAALPFAGATIEIHTLPYRRGRPLHVDGVAVASAVGSNRDWG